MTISVSRPLFPILSRFRWIAPILAIETALFAVSAQAQTAPLPKGITTDAELSFRVAPSQIVADATASGGRAVALRGPSDSFSLSVPAGEGFKIWVRHKTGPILLQSTRNGKKEDVRWVYEAPKDWKWSDFGTYTRADLGNSIVLARNDDAQGAQPQIDAVVFEPATARTLPPYQPDETAAPLRISAQIAWDKSAGQMAPGVWGVNDYEILNPKNAADAGFQKFLAETKFPMIRIHEGGFSDRWTDGATRGWNIEKIKAGFAASTGYGDSKVMMNIARWPSWLQDGNYLAPDKVDEFVALVGKLVVVMRDDVKRPVAYWELPNEKEAEYEKQGKLDELWSLFNKLSAEIKKHDPNAKVGGPAMSWPNPVWVDGFFKNCAPNADFVSWHNYGFGNLFEPNDALFEKPAGFAASGRKMRELAAQYAPGRQFETFLTEYNVKWDWYPFERRHANNVGAVFMASTMRQMGLSGVSGVMNWHAKGYYYGLTSDDNAVRLPARLYGWGTQYLIGDIAQTSVSDEKNLEILPVVRADGAKSVLLINKANRSVVVPNGTALLPKKSRKNAWLGRLDASGYAAPRSFSNKGGDLVLPGYSVTILSAATISSGR